MPRSRDFNILLTGALVVSLTGIFFAVRFYRQWHFESVQKTFADRVAGPDPVRLRGRFGDVELDITGNVSLDDVALLESCGPIAKLNFFPSTPVGSEVIAPLLSLPGLRDIWFLSRVPFTDDVIDALCRHGREIRELNFDAKNVSGQGLSRLGELPALEALQFEHGEVTGGVVSLTAGFPALTKLNLSADHSTPPFSKVEVANLPRLEQFGFCSDPGNGSSALDPQVITANLPNLDTVTVEINPSYDNPRFKISACPRLRRLALKLRDCHSQVLDEIAASSPELEEFQLDAGDFGPAEAAALAKFQRLKSLDLQSGWLKPSFLAAIAKLPHLTRLKLHDCELVPDGVDFEEWIHDPVAAIKNAGAEAQVPPDWVPLTRCGQLEELVFWSEVEMPNDLAWLKDLKSLRKLDLAEGRLDSETFVRWAPPGAAADMDQREQSTLGHRLLVEQTLKTCAQMPALEDLLLADESEVETVTAKQTLGKLRIKPSEEDRDRFGWLIYFATEPSM